jgi:FkbM family methyltransferase
MNVFIDRRFDSVYERYPLVLADIGARGGLKKNWLAARRHLRVLGFEPDKHEFGRLVDRTGGEAHPDTFFDVALHNRRDRVPLHVARDRGLSSIFEPNRAFLDTFPDAARFDTVDRHDVDADTLDNLLAAHQIDDLDFIKADTQGSELYVLEGAARALASSVLGVEVEVEFTPIYTGQPLFAEVDAFLRERGYLLFDLRPCYWKRAVGRGVGGPRGQIIWADALYLKSVTALRATVARLDPERRQSKLLRALSIALLYGYGDYALQMTGDLGDLWTAGEGAAIEQQLRAHADPHGSLPKFPGRRHLAAALRRLWERCREPHEAWSISDADLGNLE